MNPKYHLLATAAALSLGACSTDNTGTDPVPEPPKEGYKISFTVVEDSESRTTLDAGDKLRWVYTDKVGIYTVGQTPDSNTNSNALTIADVNQSPVEFIGVLPNYVTKGDMFYAYYPYDAEQSTNPAAVTLSIPAEQTQTVAGVYNGQSNPLVALPTPIEWEQNSYAGRICSARFRQLGAIVELQLFSTDEKILEEKIRSVTFESENTPLAGDFTFDLTGVTVKEELPIEGYESTKVKTTLDQQAAIPATEEEAARVYLTIAPGTYSGKIIVETDAVQYTFPLTGEMTFERAVIKGLPADLAGASQFINFVDKNVKQICVTNWDENKDGELSCEEAAKVTELGEVFYDNRTITSFDELQYFTGLRSIGQEAFYGCTKLTSINIPEGVTTIGNEAFYNCNQLKSIELPNGVTAIGERAFEFCSNLTSINIPNRVTEIGIYAFSLCENLTSITIPEGVTEIREGVFSTCRNLTNIDIPERVTAIGEGVFFNCSSLTSITIPKNVTTIGIGVFSNCSSLTSITIPEGVTTIGTTAFMDCSSLTSITIPKNVTSIGRSAFNGCSNLESVYCKPTTPPTLGSDVFAGASSSLVIYVPMGLVDAYNAETSWSTYSSKIVGHIDDADPISFKDENVKQICVRKWDTSGDGFLSYGEAAKVTELGGAFGGNPNITSLDELQYFTGLQSIEAYAFTDCGNLKSITIPENVSSIAYNAFFGCSSLTTFSGQYASEDHRCLIKDGTLLVFASAGLTDYTIPKGVTTIGAYVFSSCRSLVSINIPEGVTTIGNNAFNACTSLTSINIPNGVTTIGKYAFESCLSLESIKLPNGVTTIGNSAFNTCTSLTSITIPKNVTSIERSAFNGCSNLTSVYCKPTTPPTLGSDVFAGASSSLKIYVPMGLAWLYKAADGWSDYTSQIVGHIDDNDPIDFADLTVKQICVANWDKSGDKELSYGEAKAVADLGDAFKGNTTITSFYELQYFTGLQSIGENAFYNCSSLTSIKIPNEVTAIGGAAFSGCTSLTNINIPDAVTVIGESTFFGCTSLTAINIPDAVTEIRACAFFGCSSLLSIKFPTKVTWIGNYAFQNCSNLTSVYCEPTDPPTLGVDVFKNTSSSMKIFVPGASVSKYQRATNWSTYSSQITARFN